ncbi:lipoyl protein ligase domain-containing protein [Pseudohalioglobus lutimaris]|uniref:BPL/LPL catalytic domain-containing protein n=1 Tax=Pseudohalioglobus lutimaris TaxID=1737061 RepID=A0A2N5X5T9_9GAMM|nr:hypothetical protein [Pseudohalioglobus lutimaris]PLW69852.1 hypothetical protein C0039_04785 [Pseudohalioglobus lutimaris]
MLAHLEQEQIESTISGEIDGPRWMTGRYAQAAVVLGRSQRADAMQLERASRCALPMVRRKSGGGAVIAGPEMLSVSVFLPVQHRLSRCSAVAAYKWIGEFWRSVLARYGVDSHLLAPDEARRSQLSARQRGLDWACYSSLSHGELVDRHGRKLLGVAQIRNRHCTALTAGMYLSAPDWGSLCEVMVGDSSQASALRHGNGSLEELTGISLHELADSVPQDIEQQLGVTLGVSANEGSLYTERIEK